MTSVPKMIGTTIDLIMRRNIVDSGFRSMAKRWGQPPDEDARTHANEDPLRERDTPEECRALGRVGKGEWENGEKYAPGPAGTATAGAR